MSGVGLLESCHQYHSNTNPVRTKAPTIATLNHFRIRLRLHLPLRFPLRLPVKVSIVVGNDQPQD
jgi:hypothetical protein